MTASEPPRGGGSTCVTPHEEGQDVMAEPCIISVAITGSVPRKRDNPALLMTVPERGESETVFFDI